ncbi:hypothetical protein JCM33374_g890 [Metschnikowia sp. JCM 33374]|nr:hypothetical protein JCM33374_g890 [Metschnikowia sp. JCM 33374]
MRLVNTILAMITVSSGIAESSQAYSAENLEAYIYLNGMVSAEDNSTLTSLVFYGQNDTSEALATLDLASGDLKLTQGISSTIIELNNLGLFPRADIDYWQILNSMTSQPLARRSGVMSSEEAHAKARDENIMRTSQYDAVIARDKKAGVRKVIGTSAWPGEVVHISGEKEQSGRKRSKLQPRTYDCCDVEGCTRKEDCSYMSTRNQPCICRNFRMGSDCDWSNVLVYPNIGAQLFWHCNS